MTEQKKPVDQALDLLVYAPLGLLLEARRLLPELAERGHQQLAAQVTMARMVGRFAVGQGQVEAEKRLGRVQEQATSTLAELGLLGRNDPESLVGSNGHTAERVAVEAEPTASSTVSSAASPVEDRLESAPVDDDHLAVPDYDSLAASQVIPRLAGLSGEELEAVRAHELAKRGRKTILNRIAQLQS